MERVVSDGALPLRDSTQARGQNAPMTSDQHNRECIHQQAPWRLSGYQERLEESSEAEIGIRNFVCFQALCQTPLFTCALGRCPGQAAPRVASGDDGLRRGGLD